MVCTQQIPHFSNDSTRNKGDEEQKCLPSKKREKKNVRSGPTTFQIWKANELESIRVESLFYKIWQMVAVLPFGYCHANVHFPFFFTLQPNSTNTNSEFDLREIACVCVCVCRCVCLCVCVALSTSLSLCLCLCLSTSLSARSFVLVPPPFFFLLLIWQWAVLKHQSSSASWTRRLS